MPVRARDYMTIQNSFLTRTENLINLILGWNGTFCNEIDPEDITTKIEEKIFLDDFIKSTEKIRKKDFSEDQKRKLIDIMRSYKSHEDNFLLSSSKEVQRIIKELHDYHKTAEHLVTNMSKVYSLLEEKSDISVLGNDLYDRIKDISTVFEELSAPFHASMQEFERLEKKYLGRMGNPTKEKEEWIRQAIARLEDIFLNVTKYKAAPPKNYQQPDKGFYISNPFFEFLSHFFCGIVPKSIWQDTQKYINSVIKDRYSGRSS